MKNIIFLVSIFFISSAFSQGINSENIRSAGFDKLTESQKAQIIQQIEQTSSQSQNIATVEQVEKWVDIGTKIGKGLAGAAKELGVAANDFAKTPVGILTMSLIVWNSMGSMLLHFIGGIFIWLIGFLILFWLIRRSQDLVIIYDETSGKKKKINRESLNSDQQIGYIVVSMAIFAAGIAAMFSF